MQSATLSEQAKRSFGAERQKYEMERQTLMVKLYREVCKESPSTTCTCKTNLRSCCQTGLAKIDSANEFISFVLTKYSKVLVFGHHTDVLVWS